MSKTIEIPEDLSDLSEDDLKYLHDRGLISDEQLAAAADVDEGAITEGMKSLLSKGTPLEEVANTGDANTSGYTPESHSKMVERMAKNQGVLTQTDDGEQMPEDYDDKAWTNDKLREEIVRRNEGREEADQLSLDGNKAQLIATLEADDESRARES